MPIATFSTRKNRTVEIIEPSMPMLDEIVRFVNILAKEDTFLSFNPGHEITREEEESWVKNVIDRAVNKTGFVYWAVYGNRIVGSADVHRGASVRDWHVGTIGLMIDKDFRGEGLGKYLLQFVIDKAKQEGMRTVKLDCFADNEIALNLYKKLGFVEYGRLPDGVYRKGKFSDLVSLSQRVN